MDDNHKTVVVINCWVSDRILLHGIGRRHWASYLWFIVSSIGPSTWSFTAWDLNVNVFNYKTYSKGGINPSVNTQFGQSGSDLFLNCVVAICCMNVLFWCCVLYLPGSKLFRIWGMWRRIRRQVGPRSCCRCPLPLPGMQTASKRFPDWRQSDP